METSCVNHLQPSNIYNDKIFTSDQFVEHYIDSDWRESHQFLKLSFPKGRTHSGEGIGISESLVIWPTSYDHAACVGVLWHYQHTSRRTVRPSKDWGKVTFDASRRRLFSHWRCCEETLPLTAAGERQNQRKTLLSFRFLVTIYEFVFC